MDEQHHSRSRAITVKDLGSLRFMSTRRHIFPTSVKPEPLSRLFADEILERRVECAGSLLDPTAAGTRRRIEPQPKIDRVATIARPSAERQ
jgi:hypothetical protein